MRRFIAGTTATIALLGGAYACGEDQPSTYEVPTEQANAARDTFNDMVAFWAGQQSMADAKEPTIDVINGNEVFECVPGGEKITSAGIVTSFCAERNTVVMPAAAMQEQDSSTIGPLARSFMISHEVGHWVLHNSDPPLPTADTVGTEQQATCLGGRTMAYAGVEQDAAIYDQNQVISIAGWLLRLTKLDPKKYGTKNDLSNAYLAGTSGTSGHSCDDPTTWQGR
ncbi:MAG TPA: hypothetical protein VLF43_01885 [Candidatus Saccharimonadales bacterium]|nr:hypothetical protein [Candidatus Saccharimonadales bacterium]